MRARGLVPNEAIIRFRSKGRQIVLEVVVNSKPYRQMAVILAGTLDTNCRCSKVHTPLHVNDFFGYAQQW